MNKVLKQFLNVKITNYNNISLNVIESPQGGRVLINGEWKISFCSNNYLGLANHPAVIEASVKAMREYGVGTVAARSLSGNTYYHELLERKLAEFKCTQSALLFNSGIDANMGTIPALVKKGDVIFSDTLNHGSLIDGCRLSHAERIVYEHNNIDQLGKLLAESSSYYKRMVVTDTVFSMNGDIADLPGIVQQCEKYNAFLMVDEAHATGIFGEHAQGVVEHFGLHDRVDIMMGTLGKALGSIGGFIAGSSELITYLKKTARTFLFTTSLPVSCVAAACKAIELVQQNSDFKQKLWENVNTFKESIIELGYDTMGSQSPIVPILIGDDDIADIFYQKLFIKGIITTKIGPPYVPAGTSRLRLIVSAVHTKNDLNRAIEEFEKIGKDLKLI